MNQDEARKRVYLGASEIERVFGEPTALDDADMATAALIADFIRSRPALGKSDTIALVAIGHLSETNAALARSLMAELLA